MLKFRLFIPLALLVVLTPSNVFAQDSALQTQKQVISNFKLDNPTNLFQTVTDCESQMRGDANCDSSVNMLDLSLWQVEFEKPNAKKK